MASTRRASTNSIDKLRIRAAGATWICAVQFFIAQAVVQFAWTTPFSLAEHFISDLGNTTCGMYRALYVCSPWHVWMNISFSLQGVIILTGTALVVPLFQREPSRWIVISLFVLTGLGMIGVGVFPEDVNNSGHVISAGIQFVTGNTALIVIGSTGKTVNLKRSWFAASIILGVTGLAATILFVNGYGLGLGVGGMERIAAYTFPIWLIAAGLLILTQRERIDLPLKTSRSNKVSSVR